MTLSNLLTELNSLSWREPLWFLLPLLPLLMRTLRSLTHRKQANYADKHLMPWATVQPKTGIRQHVLIKNGAYVLAWILLSIAATGPRLALETATLEQPTKLDIMLVVDVSRSMQATDINPSRLRRAQIEIAELLARSKGNRFGVIVFAARPHLLTPLTSDLSALRFYLQNIDTLTLPTNGSEPTAALKLAQDELKNSSDPTAIILMSDGDFSTATESTNLDLPNTPVFTLGIGSAAGAAIQLKNGEWLHHEGRPVISRLNENALQTFTEGNRQRYSTASDDNSDWQQLYDEGIARLSNAPIDDDAAQNIIWLQLYHWPLFAALLLLWIALTPYSLRIHAGRRANKQGSRLLQQPAASATLKTGLIASGIILVSLSATPPALANQTSEQGVNSKQAYKNYTSKNYAAAISVYKQLSGYAARFGEGASQYKAKNYNAAITQFSRAVLNAENGTQRAAALFNLGNSYFQTGHYSAAVNVYTDALKYQPTLKNALHNLQFSRALKTAVEKRLAKNARATRMGSGPQLAPSSDSVDANQGGSLAIDESESDAQDLPLPELADLSSSALEKLINKGLGQIQLAAKHANAEKNTALQRDQLSFINARLRMLELEDQQDLLWKRLFEMEEGFPAPLAEPRPVPGVPAW